MTLTRAVTKPQTNELDFKVDTEVLVISEDWRGEIKKPSVFCSKIILEVCKLSRAKSEYKRGSHLEVSIVFADDKFVKNLNMLYRNVNRPTNVLAFPNSDPQNPQCVNDVKHKLLGDIVVSFETIKKESSEANKPFIDHVAHMVAHGMLHLLGFDHDNNKNATEMETLEIEILRKLGFPLNLEKEKNNDREKY